MDAVPLSLCDIAIAEKNCLAELVCYADNGNALLKIVGNTLDKLHLSVGDIIACKVLAISDKKLFNIDENMNVCGLGVASALIVFN